MSSYLSFYLVPRKKEGVIDEPKPLCIHSCSRSSDLYRAYYENMNVAFAGNEDNKYTELTKDKADYVVDEVREELNKAKKLLDNKIDAYKQLSKLSQDNIDNFVIEYSSSKEYIDELEENLKEVEFIADIVNDLEYSDFEKMLINID